MRLAAGCLAALSLVGCGGAAAPPPEAAPSGTVTLPSGYPERPFVRVEFDKLTWRPTEGNTLGVETAGAPLGHRGCGSRGFGVGGAAGLAW